jgi:iron complex outermembrane recepter protein
LEWEDPTHRFNVDLWGRNLSNSYYFVQLQGQIAGSVGLDVGNPAPPRTYGVTLRYNFK